MEGRDALDIGASTGGFTDVLLQRGARAVVALDVGHGQLDWGLRTDARVVVIEGLNARYLEPSHLPGPRRSRRRSTSRSSRWPRSCRACRPLLAAGADVVALVKPQFEAGREEVGRKGIVRDPAVHERVVEKVTRAAGEAGLVRAGLTPSPITGSEGNREFLLYLRQASG